MTHVKQRGVEIKFAELKSDRQNVTLQEQFKQEKKHVKTLFTAGKSEYYRKQLQDTKGDTSKTRKIIKNILPDCKSNSNGFNFENLTNKANEFNFHFANVGKNTYERTQVFLHGENVSNVNNFNVVLDDDNLFRPHPVNVETVILTIKGLKETNSVGLDGISMRFIKDALCYSLLLDMYHQYFHCNRHLSYFLETRTSRTKAHKR